MLHHRKKIPQWISGMIIALILFALPTFAYAYEFGYESEAKTLNDLGLYKGISAETFDPDLGTALNRETGIVMLIRLFGLEAESQRIENADAVLSNYSDANSISEWAKKAVAYAVQKGLVKGFPDGTIGAKQSLNGKAYCTLILRQLGYTPDYSQAPAELAKKGGLLEEEGQLFTNKDLIKDDLIGISYGSLKAVDKEGKKVIDKLVDLGVLDGKSVKDVGLLSPNLTPSMPPSPSPSPAPAPSGHSSADRSKPIPSIVQMQDNIITVRFNEYVSSSSNENGALNAANYQLLGSNGSFIENAASVVESKTHLEFEVTFDSLINGENGDFTVSITGISDLSGNIMDASRQNLSIIPFSLKAIK